MFKRFLSVAVLLLGVSLLFTNTLDAQPRDGRGKGKNKNPEQMMKRMLQAMQDNLELTDEQYEDIKTKFEEHHAEMKEVRNEFEGEREDFREQQEGRREEFHQEIMDMLNDDQKEKFAELLEKADERRHQRKGKGKGNRNRDRENKNWD